MIYEDETTVDEAVDYILSGEPVREGETPSAGGGTGGKADVPEPLQRLRTHV